MSAPASFDTTNVQGDLILGLPKRVQFFVFFRIKDAVEFRKQLGVVVASNIITTTEQVQDYHDAIHQNKYEAKKKGVAPPLLQLPGVNIAFSRPGLVKIISEDTVKESFSEDDLFQKGQKKDANALKDPLDKDSVPKWDNLFLNPIDGVILITGESDATIKAQKDKVLGLLGSEAIEEIKTLEGKVRPGLEKNHEHFGFNDGLSQPSIKDFGPQPDGQQVVPPGVILLGRRGDTHEVEGRSDITKDGSFLVFRKLLQKVPEFNKWLEENQDPFEGGTDFLGARLVGRWKSGTSIDMSATFDKVSISKDPNQVNNFNYTFHNPDDVTDQTRCPFSAHLRKTNPRGDLSDAALRPHRIIRHGITFGKEVELGEQLLNKSLHERGLYFVSYQSKIEDGFAFIQKSWANNPDFPVNKKDFLLPGVTIGLDPIIGQDGSDQREATGIHPKKQGLQFTFPNFVISRGGEYFFSPSITALRDHLSVPPPPSTE